MDVSKSLCRTHVLRVCKNYLWKPLQKDQLSREVPYSHGGAFMDYQIQGLSKQATPRSPLDILQKVLAEIESLTDSWIAGISQHGICQTCLQVTYSHRRSQLESLLLFAFMAGLTLWPYLSVVGPLTQNMIKAGRDHGIDTSSEMF